jgi:hypothetical protein
VKLCVSRFFVTRSHRRADQSPPRSTRLRSAPYLHRRFGCALALCLLNPDGIRSIPSHRQDRTALPQCQSSTVVQRRRRRRGRTTLVKVFSRHIGHLWRRCEIDDRLSAGAVFVCWPLWRLNGEQLHGLIVSRAGDRVMPNNPRQGNCRRGILTGGPCCQSLLCGVRSSPERPEVR